MVETWSLFAPTASMVSPRRYNSVATANTAWLYRRAERSRIWLLCYHRFPASLLFEASKPCQMFSSFKKALIQERSIIHCYVYSSIGMCCLTDNIYSKTTA